MGLSSHDTPLCNIAPMEPPPLHITPARADDTTLILELIHELADYERLGAEVVATADSLRQALFGASPGVEAVIARVGDETAGFALYFHNFSTFLGRQGLYLEDLFVRPAFRGRGIGRSLLIHLAQLALQRGCGRFEWAVLDWNTAARDFYTALGAAPKTAWINYQITGGALARLAAGAVAPADSPATGAAAGSAIPDN